MKCRTSGIGKKESPTYCILHRWAFASRNMNEELQTVFQAVVKGVNCIETIYCRKTLCKVI
jgi:hypothetical protein